MLDFLRRHARFVRFCVVGASGVAVNLGAFSLALLVMGAQADAASKLQANAAAVFGWVISVASNFALNDRWTFAAEGQQYHQPVAARLGRYYVSALSGLGLQLLVFNTVLWLMAQLPLPQLLLDYRLYLGNLAGIGVGTVSNYILSKKFVFKAG